MLERSLDEQGISVRAMEFSSGRSLRGCLLAGLGITICPRIAIQQYLQSGEMKTLQISGVADETSVIMISHIDKWCSPLQRAFMELTSEVVS